MVLCLRVISINKLMKLNSSSRSPSFFSKKSFRKQLRNILHNQVQIRLPLCKNRNKMPDNLCVPSGPTAALFKLRKMISNPQAPANQQPNKRYNCIQKNELSTNNRRTSLKTSQVIIKSNDEVRHRTEHSQISQGCQSFRAKFNQNRRKIPEGSFLRAVSDENQMCEEILKMRKRVISHHSIDTLDEEEPESPTTTIINYNRFLTVARNKMEQDYNLTSEQKIFQLKQILGAGANAQVRLGQSRFSGLKVAIKIFEKQKLFTKAKRNRVYSEIKILEQMPRHQNIISFIQAFENKKQIHILFQCVEQVESLKDYFKKKNHALCEKQLKSIFFKIAKGVNHLHNNGISHRDLKPANVVVGLGQDGEQVIKIIDFGVATSKQKSDAHCGTPNFMAPELINNKNQDFDMKCADIWALGAILFYLCEGRLPFKGKNEAQLYGNIKQGQFMFNRIQSKDLKQLIQQCLQIDPSKRIRAAQILRHDWFSSR